MKSIIKFFKKLEDKIDDSKIFIAINKKFTLWKTFLIFIVVMIIVAVLWLSKINGQ